MATKKKITTKPKQKTVTPEEWGTRYGKKRDHYKTFTKELCKLIETLLENRNIEVSQVQARTKETESFVRKISSPEKDYKNPLEEVTDFTGIRIITYYKEDIDPIVEIIEREFEIDWENSVDKTKELPIDRFGYQSDHYVISLSSPRKDLDEWRLCKNLKAEIQIRTALEHVWAERDHKLRYKTVQEAPPELRRRLFRLSAVLDLADDEFSALRKLKSEIGEEYSQKVEKDELDIELNLDSLEAYLESTKKHIEWANQAKEIGFRMLDISELETEWLETSMTAKSNLLTILNMLGVKTIDGFDKLLQAASSEGREVLKEYKRKLPEKFLGVRLDPYGVLAIIVLYSQRSKLSEDSLKMTKFLPEFQRVLADLLKSSKSTS